MVKKREKGSLNLTKHLEKIVKFVIIKIDKVVSH